MKEAVHATADLATEDAIAFLALAHDASHIEMKENGMLYEVEQGMQASACSANLRPWVTFD